jgi:WhiB family transcriptional regulator, redox-sensing transcriptional regulator
MLSIHIPDDPWRNEAACSTAADVDFFASDDAANVRKAKAICASCPVFDDCLGFAIETNQSDGIWGGTTPGERVKLRRTWLRDLRKAS